MAEVERILITVRTYPNISGQYVETVCTGGITDSNEWRRLYPVPLRYLDTGQQYRTWDVIRVKVKPGTDGRKETRRPENQTIQVIEQIKTADVKHQWVAPTISESMHEFLESERTLGPVAVSEVLDFIAEPVSVEWSEAEKQKIAQARLFDDTKPLEKIPFKFRLIWKDGAGVEHKSIFLSWEVCQTWRSWSRDHGESTIERMREKWLNEVLTPDKQIAFFMGNLASRRHVFMVCGTYQPKLGVVQDESLF
ncbi:MAG: hypothetical protein AAF711_13170 [Planctomycetota bacterium]